VNIWIDWYGSHLTRKIDLDADKEFVAGMISLFGKTTLILSSEPMEP